MNEIFREATDESAKKVAQQATQLLANIEDRLESWEGLYRDLHMHPELSMQEHRTAGIVARYLRNVGYDVTDPECISSNDNNDNIELTSFPILSNESFTFHYSDKTGVELEFKPRRKGG